MTLDTEAVLGGAGRAAADDSVKLSTPGCALLAAILGFPKVRVAPAGSWAGGALDQARRLCESLGVARMARCLVHEQGGVGFKLAAALRLDGCLTPPCQLLQLCISSHARAQPSACVLEIHHHPLPPTAVPAPACFHTPNRTRAATLQQASPPCRPPTRRAAPQTLPAAARSRRC